ncbi:hypothetical protein PR048_031088 [Dryococelus australis]|uniref:Uncharacterized protein n=1 Tax=Dryococelus australis TaxID=614101 RepID=A0ABQ9G515_9NEOP|nr:hypothetical protein PR048_031088 [Dryococelus australis]
MRCSNDYCSGNRANSLRLLGRKIMQGDMHRGKEGLGSHGLHFGAMTTSLSVLRASLNYEEQGENQERLSVNRAGLFLVFTGTLKDVTEATDSYEPSLKAYLAAARTQWHAGLPLSIMLCTRCQAGETLLELCIPGRLLLDISVPGTDVYNSSRTDASPDPLTEGAAVSERLDCSPPTMANRAQVPAEPLSYIFACGNRARTMPLVGGFSRGSPISSTFAFRRCSIISSSNPQRFSGQPRLRWHALQVRHRLYAQGSELAWSVLVVLLVAMALSSRFNTGSSRSQTRVRLRKRCTQVQYLARRGDGALIAPVIVARNAMPRKRKSKSQHRVLLKGKQPCRLGCIIIEEMGFLSSLPKEGCGECSGRLLVFHQCGPYLFPCEISRRFLQIGIMLIDAAGSTVPGRKWTSDGAQCACLEVLTTAVNTSSSSQLRVLLPALLYVYIHTAPETGPHSAAAASSKSVASSHSEATCSGPRTVSYQHEASGRGSSSPVIFFPTCSGFAPVLNVVCVLLLGLVILHCACMPAPQDYDGGEMEGANTYYYQPLYRHRAPVYWRRTYRYRPKTSQSSSDNFPVTL